MISSLKGKWWVYTYLFKKAGCFVKLLQSGAHVGYFYQTFVGRPVGERGSSEGRGRENTSLQRQQKSIK